MNFDQYDAKGLRPLFYASTPLQNFIEALLFTQL